MRVVMLISYDGTEFCGFQVQPQKRTVQGELERAANEIFGQQLRITGSGRTDSGVHALGQVCHFDVQTEIPVTRLRECFNRVLPPDLKVLESASAPDGFDCSREAKRKTYCYSFYYAKTAQPLLERYCARVKEKPDTTRMQAAAKLLIGEHDFRAFCATGSSAKTSMRKIFSAEVEEYDCGRAFVYRIRVCGNGFLYNMVRILAGELYAVGCGKEQGIEAAFERGERALLARTMPAQGLLMESVEYGFPLFGRR